MTRTLLTAFGLTLCTAVLAQTRSTVDAVVETKRFRIPGKGQQVDVNIAVLGTSVIWATNTAGARRPRVEALVLVEKDSTIVDFRKSDVAGPERLDTLMNDFLVEEHFLLAPGSYALSVELHDPNGPEDNRSVWKGPLVVPEESGGLAVSDILLTAGTRTGQDGRTEPQAYTGTYYPAHVDQVTFYAEVYGSDALFGPDSLFAVGYQIEGYEDHLVKGLYKRVQKVAARSVVPVNGGFPIADLPSGNYVLAVEALDRTGAVLARQEQFFQRNKPVHYDLNAMDGVSVTGTFVDLITDRDTLAEFVACLRPVADDLERRMIDDRWRDKDPELMRRLFYTFWLNRDPADPKGAWEKYRERVRMANRMYACRNLKGYESDRGMTFLRYGLPSTVVDGSNDNKQLPYLIWHYYKAGRYADRRFVFWQQNVGIGCWDLLHSEIPGEIKTPNWQTLLSMPLGPAAASDGVRVHSIEGERVLDNFNNPH
jgi:GWxTD domain-containing protein